MGAKAWIGTLVFFLIFAGLLLLCQLSEKRDFKLLAIETEVNYPIKYIACVGQAPNYDPYNGRLWYDLVIVFQGEEKTITRLMPWKVEIVSDQSFLKMIGSGDHRHAIFYLLSEDAKTLEKGIKFVNAK